MDETLHLEVNGEAMELPPAASVTDLLERIGLAGGPCAVEVNAVVVPRREHEAHVLRDGDTIEIVTLVGGG